MVSNRHKGVTRVEMMTLLLIVAFILSIGALTFGQGKTTELRSKKTIKDSAQLEQIHQAMLIFAREWNGTFPRPGMINRLADPELGRQVPGRGPEDIAANTTANLFSCMIAQNYMTPELPISPIERNPNVKAKQGFNYDNYNPVDDKYWDDSFKADLKTESNVSYAHPPLTDPWVKEWRDGMRMNYAQLGNRGPKDGRLDPDSYTCGPHGHWAGNVVLGDNSVSLHTTTKPADLDGDNFFAVDKDREFDSLLAFTREIKDGVAALQFD